MLRRMIPGLMFSILIALALANNAKCEGAFSMTVTAEEIPADTDEPETDFHVEVIQKDEQQSALAGKRVLIYHTHTFEAYEPTESANYRQLEKWRTKDSNNNMIAVGRAITASLTALGVEVTHDTTAFEPPDIDHAYERSLRMLEGRIGAGERYDMYIDIHRDAISLSSTIRRTVNIGGQESARFMVLVGQGTTGGYQEKPDWEANRRIAQQITDELNEQCPGLARDVKIKSGRFNQHIATGAILIECGMNTNTLDQVLVGVPYLAQAIASTLIAQQ